MTTLETTPLVPSFDVVDTDRKLAFRWIYWNVLLPGRPIPLPAHMSLAGKRPAGTSVDTSKE
jgi:hypothetical protein